MADIGVVGDPACLEEALIGGGLHHQDGGTDHLLSIGEEGHQAHHHAVEAHHLTDDSPQPVPLQDGHLLHHHQTGVDKGGIVIGKVLCFK